MDDNLTPAEQAQAEQKAKEIAALLIDEADGDALRALGILALVRQEWAQNTTAREGGSTPPRGKRCHVRRESESASTA